MAMLKKRGERRRWRLGNRTAETSWGTTWVFMVLVEASVDMVDGVGSCAFSEGPPRHSPTLSAIMMTCLAVNRSSRAPYPDEAVSR